MNLADMPGRHMHSLQEVPLASDTRHLVLAATGRVLTGFATLNSRVCGIAVYL